MITNRPLRVFLCHSSQDKPAVRDLYQKLRAEPWIQPWLDEEELHPGQTWEIEIEKAVESSDVVLVCLSNNSIHKKGYVQKELRFALDIALEMPEETIFIVPLRLEECTPPRSLREWQYVDYFENQRERGVQRLLVSLQKRSKSLGLIAEASLPPKLEQPDEKEQNGVAWLEDYVGKHNKTLDELETDKITLSNGMEFMRVPAGEFIMGSEDGDQDGKPSHIVDIPYDYWMGRYPITNEQFNSHVKAKGIGHFVSDWEKKKDHPVTWISWDVAVEYCKWLSNMFKYELSSRTVIRLPTEPEWEKAARGISTSRKYPWGNQFDKNKCNSSEGRKFRTTPVGLYSPQGDSPYDCADMVGNVWEWTYSEYKAYPYNINNHRESEEKNIIRVLRGGSFDCESRGVRVNCRDAYIPGFRGRVSGFRIVIAPPLPK